MWTLLLGLASAAPPGEPQDILTVATLNTWGLPSPVASGRRSRLPLIASWLSERSYDLAGLEEVWAGARRFLLADLLFPVQRGDSGLAIATDWPVNRTVSKAFVAERGLDTWKAKGVLAAEVRVDDTPVLFGVTHLQAGGGVRNALVRAAQVQEILDVIGTSVGVPVVLLGDFNLYDDAPIDDRTRTVLEDAGFVDVAGVTGALGGTYPGLPHRFDRVYVREGETTRLVPERSEVLAKGFSDHHAVEATLRIEPRRP